MSSKQVGLSFATRSRMPLDSIWNTPTVSPRAEQLVGLPVVERERVDVRAPDARLAAISGSASFWISVSVFSPRKSNLIRPIFSMSVHVVLRQDVAVLRSTYSGTDLDQRRRADHDARGVLRGVAHEAFELERVVEQLAPRASLSSRTSRSSGSMLERLVEREVLA